MKVSLSRPTTFASSNLASLTRTTSLAVERPREDPKNGLPAAKQSLKRKRENGPRIATQVWGSQIDILDTPLTSRTVHKAVRRCTIKQRNRKEIIVFKENLKALYGDKIAQRIYKQFLIKGYMEGLPLSQERYGSLQEQAKKLYDQAMMKTELTILTLPKDVVRKIVHFLGCGIMAVEATQFIWGLGFIGGRDGRLACGRQIDDNQIRQWIRSGILSPSCGLEHLDLSYSKITERGFKLLIQCGCLNKVKSLKLQGHWVTDDLIGQLVQSENIRGLKKLNLNGCPELTDVAMEAIARSPHMSALEELSLVCCPGVTDIGVESVAWSPHMSALGVLNLIKCFLLTDRAAQAIAGSFYMSALRVLDFSYCAHLTDEGVGAITRSPYMSALEELSLFWCPKLTDRGVQTIAGSPYMSVLRRLYLSWCSRLTDEGIKTITRSSYMSGLEKLYLNGCSLLTTRGVQAISKSRYTRATKVLYDQVTDATS